MGSVVSLEPERGNPSAGFPRTLKGTYTRSHRPRLVAPTTARYTGTTRGHHHVAVEIDLHQLPQADPSADPVCGCLSACSSSRKGGAPSSPTNRVVWVDAIRCRLFPASPQRLGSSLAVRYGWLAPRSARIRDTLLGRSCLLAYSTASPRQLWPLSALFRIRWRRCNQVSHHEKQRFAESHESKRLGTGEHAVPAKTVVVHASQLLDGGNDARVFGRTLGDSTTGSRHTLLPRPSGPSECACCQEPSLVTAVGSYWSEDDRTAALRL